MRPRPIVAASLFTLVVVLRLLRAAPARAAPWLETGEDALEDRMADGDLDEEDQAVLRLDRRPGSSDLHGASWVSVVGFERELRSGRNDVGGVLVVGLALDRVAAGPVHGTGDPPIGPGALDPPAGAWAGDRVGDPADDAQEAPPRQAKVRLAAPGLARRCVAAAWRSAGLGTDDARIDALISRSRASALLPETRLRAMRLWDDASHATTLATTDDTSYYDAIGANLVLEVRLTWRLDRLLYAGDEPTLERVRLERQDARARVAARTLQALFAWQRALVGAGGASPGSPERAEGEIRAAEAEATLDVLTGGWFSSREP
jgi:hypothetical protein